MAKATPETNITELLSSFLDDSDLEAAVINAVARKVERGRLDPVTLAFALAKAGLDDEAARAVLDKVSRGSGPARRTPARRPASGTSATPAAKSWWASLDKATQSGYRSEFGAASRGRASDDLIQKAYNAHS